MFSQQDGRQPVPGMPMQNPHMQQNMGHQMQIQNNPQMHNVAGMQQPGPSMQQGPGQTTMTRMGAIGQQHSINNPGVVYQQDVGPRPINVGMQQSVAVKTESQTGMPQVVNAGGMQRPPAPVNQPTAQPKHDNTQHDKVMKFKLLLPQLKDCLVNLIAIARHNFAANAAIDNAEKNINTSSIPRFDKALEQFFAICNLIERHLLTAHDQVAHSLYSMQYTPMTANQMRDGHTHAVYPSYIETVQLQLAWVKEVQAMLVETSSKITTRQNALQQQQIQQASQQRQQF